MYVCVRLACCLPAVSATILDHSSWLWGFPFAAAAEDPLSMQASSVHVRVASSTCVKSCKV